MSTTGINSLLSSLTGSNTESLSELLGNSSTSTNPAVPAALQDAVNAILNSATNTSGSGIDVQSTVDAILEMDATPEENLQAQVSSLSAQNSALQTIESDLEAFQQSVETLTDATGGFGALSVSSSNNDVVSATAANGTTPGTHTITVNTLATTAAQYTAAFDSASDTLPTGSFDLLVGPASDTNQPVTIPIDSADSTNTLTGLASYINLHNLGVNASVITDASGSMLALVSQTSGTAGQISITDDTTAPLASAYFSSPTATLTTGAFELQVGSNAAVSIPVNGTQGTNTLSGLESYINQQNLGVSASVVTDTNGSRLELVPQSSGAAGPITVPSDTTGMDFQAVSTGGMEFTQAMDSSTGQPLGEDASLTVDGIPITSSSNTVSSVIPGVTLTLSSTSSQPVTLDVSPDLTTVATDINNFISAYNTVMQDINTQNQTSSSTGSAGTLLGDAGMDLVQTQLLSDITTSITGNSGLVNLQSIGISVQDDGTLSVDSSSLNNVLANNFSAVQNLFQSSAPSGVATTLNQDLQNLTNPVTGPLYSEMNGISQETTDLNNQISDFQAQLQNTQQNLLAEYSQINTTLEQLPETLASINSQLNALNPPQSSS